MKLERPLIGLVFVAFSLKVLRNMDFYLKEITLTAPAQ